MAMSIVIASIVSCDKWERQMSPLELHRKWKVKGKSLSRVRLSATPWTAAYQAPPSMGFSRQEYWSGVPLPSPWCHIPTVKPSPKSQVELAPNSSSQGPLCLLPTHTLILFRTFWPSPGQLESLRNPSDSLRLMALATLSRSIHVIANDIISFFLWLSNIPLYKCTISSLSIPLSVDI